MNNARTTQAETLKKALFEIEIHAAIERLRARGYYARRYINDRSKIKIMEFERKQGEFGVESWSKTSVIGPLEVFKFLDARN